MNSDTTSNTSRIRQIYTDGGCHNGPDDPLHGVGSWAFLEPVDLSQGYVDVYGEYVTGSTNNITEMLAIINGIKYINTTSTEAHPSIHIISDSGYVVRGYNDPSYLDRWMARGWRTSANGPVLNRNLWEKIVTLSWHAVLNLELIKGHKKDNNHIHAFWNDICDRICTYIMENKTEENKRYHFKYYFEDKFIQEVI